MMITMDTNLRPAVCMCLWQRVDRLPDIIEALENQTYKNFEYLIWDNSCSPIVKELLYKSKLNTHLYYNDTNEGSQARFWLVPKSSGNPIIFFDDDQIPKPDFVEYMTSEYIKRPNAVQSRKIRIFGQEFYWRDSNGGTYGEPVDYCGTGGMVLDRSLFKDERLMKIESPFEKVEDLYLSYVARHFYGMDLIAIKSKVNQFKDGKNQLKLFKLGSVKQKCFTILRQKGWKLLKDKDNKEI